MNPNCDCKEGWQPETWPSFPTELLPELLATPHRPPHPYVWGLHWLILPRKWLFCCYWMDQHHHFLPGWPRACYPAHQWVWWHHGQALCAMEDDRCPLPRCYEGIFLHEWAWLYESLDNSFISMASVLSRTLYPTHPVNMQNTSPQQRLMELSPSLELMLAATQLKDVDGKALVCSCHPYTHSILTSMWSYITTVMCKSGQLWFKILCIHYWLCVHSFMSFTLF
jgi:hypothetical protein